MLHVLVTLPLILRPSPGNEGGIPTTPISSEREIATWTYQRIYYTYLVIHWVRVQNIQQLDDNCTRNNDKGKCYFFEYLSRCFTICWWENVLLGSQTQKKQWTRPSMFTKPMFYFFVLDYCIHSSDRRNYCRKDNLSYPQFAFAIWSR